MIAQTPPPARTRMTNAVYLALPETTQPTELIDGEIIFLPGPNADHQDISMNLTRILLALIPDGRLYAAPTDVVFEEGEILQPDIFWAREGGRCVKIEKRLYGPPDLIVEILSPSTEARDRKAKYLLYERHGVREYWLVNPEEQFAEVYTLADGAFRRVGVFVAGEDAEFTSPLLEKAVGLAAIFTA
jgi:Uma2 family endonuclease